MVQDSSMNAPNQKVRPNLPVGSRPHVMFVPCGADKDRLVLLKPSQTEFTPFAFQVTVEVRRVDVIGGQFLHGWWLGDYVKSEAIGFVPYGYWFHEGACGEVAVADCSHTRSLDGSAGWASDSKREKPVFGRWQFGKGHDVIPYLFGWSIHQNFRADREEGGFGEGFLLKTHE